MKFEINFTFLAVSARFLYMTYILESIAHIINKKFTYKSLLQIVTKQYMGNLVKAEPNLTILGN